MSPEPTESSPAIQQDNSASAPSSTKKGGPRSKTKQPQPSPDHKFQIGDIVLARLRGYPPWPARVADPEHLPTSVLRNRPGKNTNHHCCQFFPAGDFSWLQPKDIRPLSNSDIDSFLSQPHRKASGGLRDAYKTAQDPTEWDEQQQELHQQQAEAEANVDELDDDDEPVRAKGGKRKRAIDDGKKNKAAKKEEEPKSKKAKAASSQPTAVKAKPEDSELVHLITAEYSFSEAGALPANSDTQMVKDWRHKLQKGFLSNSLPAEKDMPDWDETFKVIEEYDGMTIEALSYSKIGKVMKKIQSLPNIPLNEKYKFTDRASKLMRQWQDFIAASKGVANGASKEAEQTDQKVAESIEDNKVTLVANAENKEEEVLKVAETVEEKTQEPVEMAEGPGKPEEPAKEANGDAKMEVEA
nr:hypothetical protein L204_05530 [Cryptococcus depauperatus CBS 7855]